MPEREVGTGTNKGSGALVATEPNARGKSIPDAQAPMAVSRSLLDMVVKPSFLLVFGLALFCHYGASFNHPHLVAVLLLILVLHLIEPLLLRAQP